MKTKILFVDEDQNVLNGLRRILREMRREWDMEFVMGGRAALDRLVDVRYEVVVSGLEMPGMDDKEFLGRIAAKYPDTLRIVLSSQTDKKNIAHLAGTAHQYLSKPCDPALLKSAIVRSYRLRDVIDSKSVKRIISQIDSLPSLPSLYFQLMQELNSKDSSIKKIGDIIASDVGMTAKVLKLVNSSYFGLPRHVANPTDAAVLIGMETISALVISAQAFSQFDPSKIKAFMMDEFVIHSLKIGELAKELAIHEKLDKAQIDHSMIAGLLHDCGKLILASNLIVEYNEVLRMVEDDHLALANAERKVLGTTHAEVGAALMGIWGLPDAIIEAIAFHHNPIAASDVSTGPLTTVYIANSMQEEGSKIDHDYLKKIDAEDRLPEWQKICNENAVFVFGC